MRNGGEILVMGTFSALAGYVVVDILKLQRRRDPVFKFELIISGNMKKAVFLKSAFLGSRIKLYLP